VWLMIPADLRKALLPRAYGLFIRPVRRASFMRDRNVIVWIIVSPSKRWHNSCDLATGRGAGDLQDQIIARVSGRCGGNECDFACRDGPLLRALYVRGLSGEDAFDYRYN